MTLLADSVRSHLPVPYGELPPEEPGPFAPCVLFLDSSSSMSSGDAIDEVNDGLRQFEAEIKEDEIARNRVDIAVVEFKSAARCVSSFTLAREFQAPKLTASGATAMGAALELGHHLYKQRRDEYRQNGVKALCGMGVLLTDGGATDDISRGVAAFKELIVLGKVDFFCAGTSTADFETLKAINPDRAPLRLADHESIVKLFRWISDSLKTLSRSTPGQPTGLPPTTGWGTMVA